MKIRYNAPTSLSFALIASVVLILSETILPGLEKNFFTVGGKGSFVASDILCWVRLFSHVIGHANWNHLISNFSFILLLGPILEQMYGSTTILVMIAVTALVTGVLNVLFFPSALMGASGVVFMMILLASFTNFNRGEIPLTFILILILYLGRELLNSFRSNDISEFAHIVGGFCGSLFGFFRPAKR